MKAFKDLQKGDKIYYWDKGKLHEQIVHDVEIKDEISTYKDWYGKITENHREVVNIVAGKNNRTKLDLYWGANQSCLRYNCLLRFSCIESANEWASLRMKTLKIKIDGLERRVNNLKKLYNNLKNC